MWGHKRKVGAHQKIFGRRFVPALCPHLQIASNATGCTHSLCIHSHTPYIHKLPHGPGWPLKSWSAFEVSIHVPLPKKWQSQNSSSVIVILRPRYTCSPGFPSWRKHVACMPHGGCSHGAFTIILIFDFISNNCATKLFKSVHTFQFLTHLQGKSEQPQHLHHLNISSACNHTQRTLLTETVTCDRSSVNDKLHYRFSVNGFS